MEVFVDGGLAHANEAKYKLYKEWKSIPPFFPMVESQFVTTLTMVPDIVAFVKALNTEAILLIRST